MRVLLDTHTFLWWIEGNRRLSRPAKSLIADETTEVLVSAASVWEIAIKIRLGKLSVQPGVGPAIAAEIDAQGFLPFDITPAHAQLAGTLPMRHRDPFDRMLVAQALSGGLPLVSNDELFDDYGVSRIW